jgi:hypothetical protein
VGPHASTWLLALAALAAAGCGGRSDLDDYADGIPTVVRYPSGEARKGTGNDDTGGDDSQHDDDKDGGGDGDASSTDGGAGGHVGDGGAAQSKGAVGDACDKNDDCKGKNATCVTKTTVLTFVEIDFPNGFCTITNCQSDDDCPSGTGCLKGLSQPACTPLCEKDDQCRKDEGYTCSTIAAGVSSDTRKFCQPPNPLSGGTGTGGILGTGTGGIFGGNAGTGGT